MKEQPKGRSRRRRSRRCQSRKSHRSSRSPRPRSPRRRTRTISTLKIRADPPSPRPGSSSCAIQAAAICLFHALEGRTLNGVEMLAIRGKVATVRRRTPDTPLGPNYNANVVAATILQPDSGTFRLMVAGRDAVPNRVLALLQSIPGVYAGPEELIQWCRMRNRTVYVIDRDGSLREYNAARKPTVGYLQCGLTPGTRARRLRRMRRLIEQRHLVLYKSPAHWELSPRISGTFGQAPAVDQER